MEQLDILKERLGELCIEVEFVANYPWIYLHKINGELVTEVYKADHGFTIAFLPPSLNKAFHFTNLRATFKLIRKYCK